MESCPLLDLGNLITKSMAISCQGMFGIGRGVYKPWGRLWTWPSSYIFHKILKLVFASVANKKVLLKSPKSYLHQSAPLRVLLGIQRFLSPKRNPSCMKN